MKLKQFQKEDLARAALHDGLILGLDTGLGKTICAYLWPLLKVNLLRKNGRPVRPLTPAEPVLIVAQGDLHDQIIAEGLRHFGTRPTVIDSQATFLKLSSLSPSGRRTLPPGYYLTTYTQLSSNGIIPFPELDAADPERMLRILHLTRADVEEFFDGRAERYDKFYRLLGVLPTSSLPELRAKWFRERKHATTFVQESLDEAFHVLEHFAAPNGATNHLSDLNLDQQKKVALALVRLAHSAYQMNLGESHYYGRTDRNIKCVYSPSLADLCSDTFSVLVADEGTKIKGEETLIGKGTRQMNPRYRLPMTATPIKNRLPDIFRLAHWSTGAHHLAHPRFPFSDADRDTFAAEFSVSERNLSAEERSEGSRRFVKLTPQVCQIHRLWKFLSPIVLRRRKKDCGEALVSKLRQVVRVPMGRSQAEVYKFHLEAKYKDIKGHVAMGAKLQALRIAAANPASLLLKRPDSDSGTEGPPRSNYGYVPKLASALALIKDILERKEQVIVFSAFHDSLDALSAHLREAGVAHQVLDGRTSQAKRGAAAARFKKGLASGIPVMLAGVECMSEGHSFHLCNNVILMAYSWAYDKFEQAINRIHRMNSPKDVNVYPIVCEGSIDRKLEAMIQEKGDAAELVLDGHLLGENPSEVNLAELLQIAEQEFADMAAAGTIDERELEKEWPALRSQLAAAAKAWSGVSILPASFEAPKIVTPRLAPTPVEPPDEPWVEALPLWRLVAAA